MTAATTTVDSSVPRTSRRRVRRVFAFVIVLGVIIWGFYLAGMRINFADGNTVIVAPSGATFSQRVQGISDRLHSYLERVTIEHQEPGAKIVRSVPEVSPDGKTRTTYITVEDTAGRKAQLRIAVTQMGEEPAQVPAAPSSTVQPIPPVVAPAPVPPASQPAAPQQTAPAPQSTQVPPVPQQATGPQPNQHNVPPDFIVQ
jgi:hypothetical protein